MNGLGLNWAGLFNGVYQLFDKDGFHYSVFGVNIIKTTDDNDPRKPIRVVRVKNITEVLPADLAKGTKRLVGMGMTYDGHLVAATSGALLALDRELEPKGYVTFPGDVVENSIAIDEAGGIYVVTSKRMHKVVWTGARLSTDAADGAWQSEYDTPEGDEGRKLGAISLGSGTTPTLMGFGDDPDKLVVIVDANPNGANVVAFWRDKIPEGLKQKPGAKSARIAGQIRLDISKLTTESSAVVLGYGALLINSTYPKPTGDFYGNLMSAGITRPAPMGVQKFTWNPSTHAFENSWVNKEIDCTDLVVPVASARSGLVYVEHKEKGIYEYLGLDWNTGQTRARWSFPDESRMWNTAGSLISILEDGDLLASGLFTIKRLNVGDGK